MKVTPNPERRAKLLDNARSVSNVDTQREGIHLSDLTQCVTKSFWSKYGKHKEKTPDKTVMFFLIGLGLEKMLRGIKDCPCIEASKAETEKVTCTPCRLFPPHSKTCIVAKCVDGKVPVEAPEPDEKDGILYSPDHWDDEFNMFDEMKSTRMGWKKDATEPSKGWPIEWVRRIMGYCYATGTTKWGLDVFLVIPAELQVVDFEFSVEELEEFWLGFIIPRKWALIEALESGVPPTPYEYNEDYECKNCEAALMCENAVLMKELMEKTGE
ncbi:hypothetical protein LCGC14_2312350 [marine sediment metagenome]|uniref:PD-(D/E)XK endonuclease-like domain-containing protein n=1 Tax=marine sediment metagenome TaxID=412755 RepID=A0A0F9CKW0_9ZZZZ